MITEELIEKLRKAPIGYEVEVCPFTSFQVIGRVRFDHKNKKVIIEGADLK